MTLAELIIKYRSEHDLSQRRMAAQCGLSTGYISLIEKEINPQTGKAMVPSLAVLNKLAKGMLMSIDELLSVCDDMPVELSADDDAPVPEPISADEQTLISLYRSLNAEGQEKLLDYADDLAQSGKYIKTPAAGVSEA